MGNNVNILLTVSSLKADVLAEGEIEKEGEQEGENMNE